MYRMQKTRTSYLFRRFRSWTKIPTRKTRTVYYRDVIQFIPLIMMTMKQIILLETKRVWFCPIAWQQSWEFLGRRMQRKYRYQMNEHHSKPRNRRTNLVAMQWPVKGTLQRKKSMTRYLIQIESIPTWIKTKRIMICSYPSTMRQNLPMEGVLLPASKGILASIGILVVGKLIEDRIGVANDEENGKGL